MQITKTSDGQIEFALSFEELDTIKNCLNEVGGGFEIADFKARIGVYEDVVSRLADEMVSALSVDQPDATDREAAALPDYMRRLSNRKITATQRARAPIKIVKEGADRFCLTAPPAEARIFINCMKETLPQGRGEAIPLREYQTRVGATVEEVKAIISAIEGALAR